MLRAGALAWCCIMCFVSNSSLFSDQAYSHLEVESKWTNDWCNKHIFKTQIHPETKNNPEKKPFSIALPPPNVTGELHMGHALSGTIQDLLIRRARMQGRDVLWQIGTDHAGIGTQIVVEKFLKKNEKITRYELGREKFIERTKAWKEEYGNKIVEQMKKLGFSPDWNRCRYTMDDHYAKAVQAAFKKYFDDGLIYRGKRVVNWCPKCQTSLSDLEVEQDSRKGTLYHIKYQIKDSDKFIVVATTRPETLFGDTGVAVHPDDDRYKEFVGKVVVLPFNKREIPVVADEHVKPEFGTGAVKVTPAHDANDFEIAQRHDLPMRLILDEKAKMLEVDDVPEWLYGLDRYEAREKTVEKLEAENFFDKVSDYDQEKDLHDRCHTEIEPYLSDQWYVNMDHDQVQKSLAKIALNTVSSSKAKFSPERYENPFKAWLENIRDWCISRQIWWGHRIPVFYYKDENFKKENGHYPYFVDLEHSADNLPKEDPVRKIDLAEYHAEDADGKAMLWQDPDVLDTWFSSALWPFETMRANMDGSSSQEVYEHFYPSNVLATAREIINLWVTRMIFSSEYFEGKEPFTDILIHPVVQTPDGKRMSKSKGNAIDPLEMVNLYGADASRMWYASVGVYGAQDVKFPGRFDKSKKQWSSDTLEQYRKFANKLFNAAKFVVMNLGDDFKPESIDKLDPGKLNIADKWIMNKFHKLLDDLAKHDPYDFAFWTNSVYEFLWFDFCDWYIELSKNQVTHETKQILFHILEASLRALHPLMPFITEEIWQGLKSKYDFTEIKKDVLNAGLDNEYQESICFAQYPQASEKFVLAEDRSPVDHMIAIISAVRNARQTLGIAWSKEINLHLNTDDNYELASINEGTSYIKSFTKAAEIVVNGAEAAKPSSIAVIDKTTLSIPLATLVDLDKIQASTKKKIESINKDLGGLENRLQSDKFMQNASPEKIQETREALEALLSKKALYEDELANLSAS